MFTLALSIVCGICTLAASLSSEAIPNDIGFTREFGFGVQRLRLGGQRDVLEEEGSRHFSAASASSNPTCANVSTNYFPAVVDNFAPISLQQTWTGKGQRYWLNDELWGGPGFPIFVYIGGEWEESCRTLTPGHKYFYELAIEHEALLVNVEHRFYGDSFPFSDTSTQNLQYLSALQGIADLARLLEYVIDDKNATESRVVTIGGSYAGNLAAWFRLKYPHISHGSIASSAPLTAKANFFEYMEVVNDAMVYYAGDSCPAAFRSAAEAVAALAAGGPGSSGFQTLDQLFQTCSPLSSEKDLSILLSNLMGNIQGTVQYNKRRATRMNVTDICDVMLNVSSAAESNLDRFVILASKYREMYGLQCEDASWSNSIAFLSNTTNDPRNNHRPWTFQTCNEFGYFQTTDSLTQPFSSWTQLNMSFYGDICFEAFDGWTQSPQTDWMNSVYGGVGIAGTEIIFPAGSIDPWHVLGIFDQTPTLPDSSLEPLYITGTAHCHDLSIPWHTDIAALTAARETIAATVARWVADTDAGQGPYEDDDDETTPLTSAIIAIAVVVVLLLSSLAFFAGQYIRRGRNLHEDAPVYDDVELTTSNVLREGED